MSIFILFLKCKGTIFLWLMVVKIIILWIIMIMQNVKKPVALVRFRDGVTWILSEVLIFLRG